MVPWWVFKMCLSGMLWHYTGTLARGIMARHGTDSSGTEMAGTARHGKVRHGQCWHGTARTATARFAVARHSTEMHGTARVLARHEIMARVLGAGPRSDFPGISIMAHSSRRAGHNRDPWEI